MNKNQRLILAIFVPSMLYVIALFFITEIIPWNALVWLVFLIIVCIFEYKLFADKKVSKEK